MDITWYGLSCFRIREGGVTVVCDPFDNTVGKLLPRIRADIVTISHDRPGHSSIERLTGEPKVLSGPGEYEVSNVFITGLTTYHRKESDKADERNVIYFLDFDGLTVGHLGDLGEVPSQSEIEELNLGELDILLVPVGGGSILDPTRAVEVIGMFEPKLVIPMHYQQDEFDAPWTKELEPVDNFLRALGTAAPEPQPMLKVAKSSLPEETEVVILASST